MSTTRRRSGDALHHFCRNRLNCRAKLPTPVANKREAFDAKGCFDSFYRYRCLKCERDMPRNAEHQRVCYRAECKKAWRDGLVISRFLGLGSGPVITPTKKAAKPGTFSGEKAGRGWRVVAGPSLDPRSLAATTLSAEVPRRRRVGLSEEMGGRFTEPRWQEVVSADGVKCFVTRFRDEQAPSELPTTALIPDDLSIPDFLRRRRP